MPPIAPRLLAPCALLVATTTVAEPLAIRDQNPLTRGLYLPASGEHVDSGDTGWQWDVRLLWTNTANAAATATERLRVDEESVELTLAATRQAGGWQLRASLPVVQRSGGALDGFIDSWHRLFGMPQGVRPALPRNAYALEYQRLGQPTVAAASGTALGDLALEAGHALHSGPRLQLSGWVGAELPTGSTAALTGNGALDAAAWLAAEAPLGAGWTASGRAGVSRSGAAGPLPLARTVGFATGTLAWQVTGRTAAVVQLDAHSATAQATHLPLLREAVLLTVGGRWRLASGGVLEAGVVEDIQVNHSPDVSLFVRWRQGR